MKDSLKQYFPTAQEKVLLDDWMCSASTTSQPRSRSSIRGSRRFDISQPIENRVSNQSVSEFWLHLQDEFKIMSEEAKLVLVALTAKYVKQDSLSTQVLKQKNRSRLDPVPDILSKVSSMEDKMRKLSKIKSANICGLSKCLYVILCNISI